MNYRIKETIPTIVRLVASAVLTILVVVIVRSGSFVDDLVSKNIDLQDRVSFLALEQTRQQILIEGLAEELSIELEGLRTETSSQIEEAKKTVAATKRELKSAIEEGKEKSLTEVVSLWRGRIAFVQCHFNFLGARLTQRGAATFFVIDGEPSLVTNRHVVEGFSGEFEKCHYRFPQDDDSIDFPEKEITFGINEDTSDPDYATVRLTSPNEYVSSLVKSTKNKTCQVVPQIGDEVIIIGFPTIGSNRDVTVTEGIIAAVEDDHYVTSAKVDSGNSGGAAIHVDSQCYLGIPTFTALGQAESLARILRFDKISF